MPHKARPIGDERLAIDQVVYSLNDRSTPSDGPLSPVRRPGAPRHASATLALGAVMISFAPVFVRVAPVGPAAAGFYRVLIGGAALAGIAVVRRRPFAGRAHLWIAILAGGLLALDLVLWHASIRDVGPGLATILANFQVFVLAGVGVFVLGERLNARLVLAVPLAMAGLALLVGVDWADLPAATQRGVVLGLLAAAAYAGFLLALRGAQRRPGADPAATLAVVCAIASVALLPMGLREAGGVAIPHAGAALILLAYALTAQVVAWMLITGAVPHVPAGQVGLLLLLQPSLAFVWDILFFDRPTDVSEMTGALLAVSAIYLGTRGRE